jgi:hypothetical protein
MLVMQNMDATFKISVGAQVWVTNYLGEQSQSIRLPKVVVKWLTFLLRICEVPGLDLGPETSCHDLVFLFFLSLSR